MDRKRKTIFLYKKLSNVFIYEYFKRFWKIVKKYKSKYLNLKNQSGNALIVENKERTKIALKKFRNKLIPEIDADCSEEKIKNIILEIQLKAEQIESGKIPILEEIKPEVALELKNNLEKIPGIEQITPINIIKLFNKIMKDNELPNFERTLDFIISRRGKPLNIEEFKKTLPFQNLLMIGQEGGSALGFKKSILDLLNQLGKLFDGDTVKTVNQQFEQQTIKLIIYMIAVIMIYYFGGISSGIIVILITGLIYDNLRNIKRDGKFDDEHSLIREMRDDIIIKVPKITNNLLNTVSVAVGEQQVIYGLIFFLLFTKMII